MCQYISNSKKNHKSTLYAFTIVELLAVIAILTIIFTITVPIITSIFTKSKKDSYNSQINLIMDAAKNYVKENKRNMNLNNTGDFFTLYLNSSNKIGTLNNGLSNNGFIKGNIKDPLYGENNLLNKGYFSDGFEVSAIIDQNNNVIYDFYNPNLPLILNVNSIQRILLTETSKTYNLLDKVNASYQSNEITNDIQIFDLSTGIQIRTIDTSIEKTYNLKYIIEKNGLKQTRYTKLYVGMLETPKISFVGQQNILHEVNTPFIIPYDVIANTFNGTTIDKQYIDVYSTINTNAVGSYSLTYKVTDPSNNLTNSITRNVTVVDTTKPVITSLVGTNYEINQNDTLDIKSLVSVKDNYDTLISSKLNYVINPNFLSTKTPDTYYIKYNVADSEKNSADQVEITLIIKDITKPIIKLTGNVVSFDIFTKYIELGYTAIDDKDGNITSKVIIQYYNKNNVEVTKPSMESLSGVYTVKYTVQDSGGNISDAVYRTVNVRPVIITKDIVSFEAGSTILMPDAVVKYSVDGSKNITGVTEVSIVSNKVDSYKITYDYKYDNVSAVTKTTILNVVDTINPSIVLIASDVTLDVNTTYKEPGYKASDLVDGDITSKVVVQYYNKNNVEVTKNSMESLSGIYTLKYTVQDSAGNISNTVYRVVNVRPVIDEVKTITHEAGTIFEIPKTIVRYSNTDTTLISPSSNVNTNKIGSYTLSYNFEYNNVKAVTKNTTVNVIDTLSPSYSKYEFTNVNSNGFELYIYDIKDIGSGINSVNIKIWSLENGNDDLVSYTATNIGNNVYYFKYDNTKNRNEKGKFVVEISILDNTLLNTTKINDTVTIIGIDPVFTLDLNSMQNNNVIGKYISGIWTKQDVSINIQNTNTEEEYYWYENQLYTPELSKLKPIVNNKIIFDTNRNSDIYIVSVNKNKEISNPIKTNVKINKNNLLVHYIDVSHEVNEDSDELDSVNIAGSDSFLIQTPMGKNILIDAGRYWYDENNKKNTSFERIKNYLQNNNVGYIDAIIMTHFHSDHMGSLVELLNYYSDKIGMIYMYNVDFEDGYFYNPSTNMKAVKTKLQEYEKNGKLKKIGPKKNEPLINVVNKIPELSETNLDFTIISSTILQKDFTVDNFNTTDISTYPTVLDTNYLLVKDDIQAYNKSLLKFGRYGSYSEIKNNGAGTDIENNNSLLIKISYKNKSFLFGGDIEGQAELSLLNYLGTSASSVLKSDVYKLGHHGSSTSNWENFIKAVNPEYALFTIDEAGFIPDPSNNIYPYRVYKYATVVQRLEKWTNVKKMFSMGTEGNIVASCDGDTIEFGYEKEFREKHPIKSYFPYLSSMQDENDYLLYKDDKVSPTLINQNNIEILSNNTMGKYYYASKMYEKNNYATETTIIRVNLKFSEPLAKIPDVYFTFTKNDANSTKVKVKATVISELSLGDNFTAYYEIPNNNTYKSSVIDTISVQNYADRNNNLGENLIDIRSSNSSVYYDKINPSITLTKTISGDKYVYNINYTGNNYLVSKLFYLEGKQSRTPFRNNTGIIPDNFKTNYYRAGSIGSLSIPVSQINNVNDIYTIYIVTEQGFEAVFTFNIKDL